MKVPSAPQRPDAPPPPGAPKPGRPAPPEPPKPKTIPPFRSFPIDVFPESVRDYVLGISATLDCDSAFVAAPMLAVFAAAIGNSRVLRIRPTWAEPSIVWIATVARSGARKSPAFEMVMKPLEDLQRSLFAAYELEFATFERDSMVFDKEFKAWGKDKSGAPPPKRPERPTAKRIVCSDVTMEAVVDRLAENSRGILVANDELAGWAMSHNQYKGGKGSDVAHWLELHGGRQLLFDRKGERKPTILIPRASASVTGTIQLGTLRSIMTEENQENGLGPRLLCCAPPFRQRRWNSTEIPAGLQATYTKLVHWLFELPLAIDESGDEAPLELRFTPNAMQRWIEFYNRHGAQEAGLTGVDAAKWSKLEGGAARFALIVHCVRQYFGEVPVDSAVDERSLAAGIEISEWFGHEARRVHRMLKLEEEQQLLRELREIVVLMGGRSTVRAWQRKRSLDSAEEAGTELQRLVDAKLGKWEHSTPGPQGGAPSKSFVLVEPPPPEETPEDDDPDGDLSGIALEPKNAGEGFEGGAVQSPAPADSDKTSVDGGSGGVCEQACSTQQDPDGPQFGSREKSDNTPTVDGDVRGSGLKAEPETASATVGSTPAPSTATACRNCRGMSFWRLREGCPWVCASCTPSSQPPGELEWRDSSSSASAEVAGE